MQGLETGMIMQDTNPKKEKDSVKKAIVISIIAGSILSILLTVLFSARAAKKAPLHHYEYDSFELNDPWGLLNSIMGSGSASGNSGSNSGYSGNSNNGNGGSYPSGGTGSQGSGNAGTSGLQGNSGFGQQGNGNGGSNWESEDDYLMSWYEEIDSKVPYSLIWSFDSFKSDYGNVSWTYSYYYLEQKGVDYSAINQKIKDACGYATQMYLRNYEKNDPRYSGNLQITGNCYCAYNTADKISIYSIQAYSENGLTEHYITSCNIDLVTGEVIANNDIFFADLEFAQRFRKQCEMQNGSSTFLEYITDDNTLLEFLRDSSGNILFFTGHGMEVGFNYDVYQNGLRQSGYVTITVNDYKKYLNPGQDW